MNNWRLLLLAVVAVLQPIESFTEGNLIDGRQECCDHRSSSFTQETTPYGNFRKSTTEDRRLNSQDIREDRRRSDTRNDPIRSRERLTVERTERRVTSETVARFNTETRFEKDQDRRQPSGDARESRQKREERRRIRESVSRDSLSRYERDALGSKRIRMSRDDSWIGRVGNERMYEGSRAAPKIRDFGRVSAKRETVAVRRGGEDVARDESRRDSRIGKFRARLQLDNNRERRTLDQRIRVSDTEDNRRSRSSDSRVNNVERDNHRTSFRTISERKQRDQIRVFRNRNIATLRDPSARTFADRRRESRDEVERADQTRKNIREYRTDVRIDVQRQHRDESRLSRERSSERRESRLTAERRQSLPRESRILDEIVRSERVVSTDDKAGARREVTRDILKASRDTTDERRQKSGARVSESTNSVLRTLRSDERRDERRQPPTRSLDGVRSDERENTARITKRNVRDERAVKYRRDVRTEERLDERREHRYESRMSRDRQISMLRESRDSAERRQETRSASPSGFEMNARSNRELRLRERDNVRANVNRREQRRASREQSLNRLARDTERRHDSQLSRTTRLAERASSEERVSKVREERLDIHREAKDKNTPRTVVLQRPASDVSATQQRSNIRLQGARTLEDGRDVTERDESGALRDRISMSRLSRERIERDEAREAKRDSRADVRNEILRDRGVRMTEKSESRRQHGDNRSQHRVLQRQTRDNLAARSVERKSREIVSRHVEILSERLSISRDERKVNEDVRNDAREIRAVVSRREFRRITEREVLPNRHNLAMERMDRTANHASRDIRIEAKLKSSDIVLAKDVRADTRRVTRDTSFRSFEAKVRDIDSIDNDSDNQNAMSWQMVFYTLQGAYLCGMLMQMLTEKSNKGKSRNFTLWWSSASKDLVKVD